MHRDATSALIRVLVCDSTPVHTGLLADMLKRDGRLHVTTSTSGSEGLTSRPGFYDVDVLLISSSLDDQPGRGFEILRGLRSANPDLRAIMLLGAPKGNLILEAFRAGARGVFSTHTSVETLNKCIHKVFEGQIWANNQQIATLVEALASSHHIRAVDARGLDLLSKRELEVVSRAAQGMSNREIAEQLHLSQHTVKNSLFRIFDKVGVSNRVELLFMTLSHEAFAQSALKYLADDKGYLSLRDEANLLACQNAADQGVLMAQVALAQFYATRPHNVSDALNAYMWYSIASDQIERFYKDVTKKLTMDQILQAEEMVAERRGRKGGGSRQTTSPVGATRRGGNDKVLQSKTSRRTKSDLEPMATPA